MGVSEGGGCVCVCACVHLYVLQDRDHFVLLDLAYQGMCVNVYTPSYVYV
jgi:hypothetical protein